jgi:hypothetical protein
MLNNIQDELKKFRQIVLKNYPGTEMVKRTNINLEYFIAEVEEAMNDIGDMDYYAEELEEYYRDHRGEIGILVSGIRYHLFDQEIWDKYKAA